VNGTVNVHARSRLLEDEGVPYSQLQKLFLAKPSMRPKHACELLHLNYRMYGETARSVKYQVTHNRRLGNLVPKRSRIKGVPIGALGGGGQVVLDGFAGYKRLELVPGVVEFHRLSSEGLVGPVAYRRLAALSRPTRNRNGQLSYNGGLFSFVLHKLPTDVDGRVTGHAKLILTAKTRDPAKGVKAFHKFLLATLEPELAQFTVDSLKTSAPDIHVAYAAPGVRQKLRLHIPGVGSLVTDKTPFPDGTVELELDRTEQLELFRETLRSTQDELADRLVQRLINPFNEIISSLKQVVVSLESFHKELSEQLKPATPEPASAVDGRRYA
jgi:hypothetical protein